MYKKKIFVSIIILLIITTILLAYIYFQDFNKIKEVASKDDINNLYMNNINGNEQIEEDSLQKYNEIIKADDKLIYKVNNMEITNRDITLTRTFNEKNDEQVDQLTIENKIVYQEAIKKGIKLKDEDSQYIDEIIRELRDNDGIQELINDNSNGEVFSRIKEKLYEDAIKNQFEHEIKIQMINENFKADDNITQNLYSEYLEVQKKWKNGDNIEYKQLLDARENVLKSYISNLKDNSIIEEF